MTICQEFFCALTVFVLTGGVACLVSCGTSARCQISRRARDGRLGAKPSALETVFFFFSFIQSVSFGFAGALQST